MDKVAAGLRESPGADAPRDRLVQNLGPLIRGERLKRRLTLAQVCERAGISQGFLSLVERGKATPSLGTLAGIADAMGLPVSAFLQVGLSPDAVTRARSRPRFSVGHSALRYERLSAFFPGQQLDAVAVHVPPTHRSEAVAHAGEEWIYVVAGTLDLSILGSPVSRLGPGDTCHFRGDAVHAYANPGAVTTLVLWVGTVPVFRNPTPLGIDLGLPS